MAKLGNPSQATTKSETLPKNGENSLDAKVPDKDVITTSQSEQPAPHINISKSSSSTDQNPFAQLGLRHANGSDRQTDERAQSPLVPPKEGDSSRPTSRAAESIEQWSNRHLSALFRISLHEGSKDSHGHALFYLSGTRAELEESEQPLELNTNLLDQALVEAASGVGKRSTPLKYLLECWKRVCRQFRTLRKNGEQDAKYQIIKEAKRLCMSYCIFAATIPEMFG